MPCVESSEMSPLPRVFLAGFPSKPGVASPMYPSTMMCRMAIEAAAGLVSTSPTAGNTSPESSLTSVCAHMSPAACVRKPYENARIWLFSAAE